MAYAVEMQGSYSFQAPDYRAGLQVCLAEQYEWMAQPKAERSWCKLAHYVFKYPLQKLTDQFIAGPAC